MTAWVVTRPGGDFDQGALITHVRAALAGYKCPKQVFELAALPRDHLGKLVRSELAVRTALSREVSALVRRGDAALGLRYFADPDPDLVSVPLYGEGLVTVCAPTHRLARARKVTAKMLAGEAWVAFPVRQGSSGESYARCWRSVWPRSG